jgi:hypothetical protein
MEISGHGNTVGISYTTMDIPVLARWNFIQRPLVAGIILGPYISLPVGRLNLVVDDKGSALNMSGVTFGIMGGFTMAYKAGPGYIVGDIRYMNDFSSLKVHEDFGDGMQDANIEIRRSVNFTLGYELSL